MALSAVFPNQKNTSNCSLPPIIFWELNTVKLFYGKTALFHRFPLNGKEMIITKILCLKITFLLLLLFEMPFWISILHPKGTHPILSIPTAFYLNHQKPQYRILRFLLIWQKIFTSKFPGTIFTGNFRKSFSSGKRSGHALPLLSSSRNRRKPVHIPGHVPCSCQKDSLLPGSI